MRYMKVWAVVALVAVAAGSALAEYKPGESLEETVDIDWQDEPVCVDGSYASGHPDTVVLEAVVVDIRNTASDHEKDLCQLDWRVSTLEDETRATPPAAAAEKSSTSTRSSGGENNNTPPAEPAGGGEPMNAVAIIGIMAALLVAVAIAGAVVLTVVGTSVAGTLRARGAQGNLETLAGYARDVVQQSATEVRRASAATSTEAGSFSALYERRDAPAPPPAPQTT